jgi:O-antigen/teichoic acid export membrane protein
MGIARSGVGWFIAKALALGASWAASMYFARALADPATTLGQFYVFETVVSFFMLASNAGINGAITKRVSEDDQPEAYVLVGIILSGLILVAATVLVALASPLLISYFGYGGLGVLFVVGMLWALQIRNTASAILEGYSLVGRSGGVSLLDTTLRVVFQVGFISAGFGLFGLLGGALAGASLASTAAVVILVTGIPLPSRDKFRDLVDREYAADMISYAKYVLLSGFSTKFYDNIDIIVITTFLGSAATGVYGIGFRFSLLLSIVSGAVMTSSLPEISSHSADGNVEQIEKILTDAIIFSTLFAIPATVGMAVIAEPLIVTIYTHKFRDAAIIATIAVGIQVPDGFRSVFSSTMNAIDRPDTTFRAGMILVVANGVLDLLLVPTVGVIGAVIASLIGISLATLYLGYHLLEELNLTWDVLPVNALAAESVAALLMGSVVWWLRNTISLPVIRKLTILILMGIAVYFLILLAISSGIRDRIVGIASDFVR